MIKEALFIGGTGTISMAITRLISTKPDWHLTVLNRGSRHTDLPANVTELNVDISDEEAAKKALEGKSFDCVCDFIGFVTEQLERDYRIFKGKTKQFMYISSASAYNKLPSDYIITEGTALANPYWEYSRNKIACEDFLMKKYREEGFPVTIIRPSHTYDERSIPMGVHGSKGSYQVIKRMLEGKPVIIHGDGSSLWTMTFNEDFAVGFAGLMGNCHAIGEAFQITSSETLTWNQIYASVASALNVELKPYYVSSYFLAEAGKKYDFTGSLIGDKSNSVVFNNSKVKAVVPEFNPSISFNDGVKRCIDYVMSHPECQVEDPEFDEWCDKVIAAVDEACNKLKN
ncbi:MAG: NAD-dependent epimerase/dehydratase family protein [Lachnospiraceae bacterium]|nr:NAD-dependent epimerase/dehydratase family protein [Lachnospiraceae bacterium]